MKRLQTMNGNLRCPRCSGFLYDARYNYRYTGLYNDKKHCFNCGRNWELIRRSHLFTIVEFPERREDAKDNGYKRL